MTSRNRQPLQGTCGCTWASLALSLLCLTGPAWGAGLSDRQGRPSGENRVEQGNARPAEGTAGKRGTPPSSQQSGPVQDTQAKAQRGAAAVMRGVRRTFSGPTDRLSRTVRERAQRVVTAPAKSAGGSRGRK